MTNTIFSTVDHFASKFKLMDSLINTVATRLLPQHEAKAGPGCPAGTYYGGWDCRDYCRPTGDLLRQTIWYCHPSPGLTYIVPQCCDCCA